MIEATFTLERDTKNTNRFQELVADGEEPKIGTIYIQKRALGNPAPQKITVTVKKG